MKFQKWHFGLIVLVAIFLLVGLVWYFNPLSNNGNDQSATTEDQGQVAGQSTNSDNAVKISEPLFFYSDTCPHCQKMKPIVEELQKEGCQIKWVDASASQNQELNNQYQITGVPAFIRPDGEKLIGEQDKATLANFLKDYKK